MGNLSKNNKIIYNKNTYPTIHCYVQNHKTHPSCGRTGPVGWVQDVGQGMVVLGATGVAANSR